MGNRPIQSTLIVGAGWVGRQIAARIAISGRNVSLFDKDQSCTEAAIDWINRLEQSGSDLETSRTKDLIGRVSSVEKLGDLKGAQTDLVIECVPEQLSVKKRTLREIADQFPTPTIIASNTSYFVPSLLSKFVTAPVRYAHIHFHVPVLHDSVTDIVGCEETSDEVLQRLAQFSHDLGLDPLLLRKEHPGYVFNWMLQALLRSALQLSALDVADRADIDKSWMKVTGMSLGPFGIMDQIGLDVIEQVLANARWADDIEVADAELLRLIQEKTNKGQLGTKTGEGFYRYENDTELF